MNRLSVCFLQVLPASEKRERDTGERKTLEVEQPTLAEEEEQPRKKKKKKKKKEKLES